ncbi:MAG: ABC transporter permease, partial [Bacteroidetes bacterium]
MFRYTFKRLALLPPGLLLISLVAFGLKQCSPAGDIELALSEMELGKDPLQRQQLYEQEYRRLLEKRDAHLPVFYVAFSSQALPDTLYRIIPQQRRKNMAALAGRYGNWSTVSAYDQALQELQTRVWASAPSPRTDAWIQLQAKVQDLAQIRTLPDMLQQLNSVDSHLRTIGAASDSLRPALAACQEAATAIASRATPWRRYLPALHFYGSNNQYHRWLVRLLKFDFGVSARTQEAVSGRIASALGWTLRINGIAIAIAFLLAVPIGVYSAVYAGSSWEQWGNLVLFLLYALPSFWVATMLGKFLTTPEYLNWFPPYGLGQVPEDASWWTALRIRATHLCLPIFCLTYGSLAFISRQVRRSMLSILQSDYIRTARAKGLSRRQVVWRHAFRNGLFPLITLFGNVLPAAVTGAVIIEYIFSIPGMGWLTLQSISEEDWPVVYALLLLLAVATMIGILLADLLYAWADPRVR